MKKPWVLCFALLLFLSGCTTKSNAEISTEFTSLEKIPSEKIVLSGECVTGDYDLSQRSDAMSCCNTEVGVFAAKAMFRSSDFTETLCYYDPMAHTLVPVCTVAGCTHDSASPACQANLTGLDAWRGMVYCDGWLYISGKGKGEYENHYCLWRIAVDGAGREIVTSFGRYTAEDSIPSGDWMIHRDNVYYTRADSGSSISIYCKRLSGGKETKLYTLTGTGCSIIRLKGAGNGFYFQTFVYEDSTLKNFTGGLQYYDFECGIAYSVIPDCYRSYCIGTDGIYCNVRGKIGKWSPIDGSFDEFLETDDFGYLSMDERYLYVTGAEKLEIYELSGVKVGELPSERDIYTLDILCSADDELIAFGITHDSDNRIIPTVFCVDKDKLSGNSIWEQYSLMGE